MLRAVLLVGLVLLLNACAGTEEGMRGRGMYKIGAPYVIEGTTYYPQEDYGYDETGIASWYGPGFHGKTTANGETYDQTQLTAAHRTLPMPSLVRVTNLENGKSVIARINDRGPFARGRIIDMSHRGAQLLGFVNSGTAKVRVQILADESRAIADAARHKGTYAAGRTTIESPDSAPVERVTTVSLDNQPTVAPPEVQSSITTGDPVTVTNKQEVLGGTTANIEQVEESGRYLPPVKSTNVPVPSTSSIYVQAGAFTKQANATKLAQQLGHIGATEITEVDINGLHFWRVRLPAKDVAQADAMLSRVISAGQAGAKIVIDR
ncbi:MAG: septal ring lytic transglycosylase RlpA family protein [Bdellovibrionales bacterium]